MVGLFRSFLVFGKSNKSRKRSLLKPWGPFRRTKLKNVWEGQDWWSLGFAATVGFFTARENYQGCFSKYWPVRSFVENGKENKSLPTWTKHMVLIEMRRFMNVWKHACASFYMKTLYKESSCICSLDHLVHKANSKDHICMYWILAMWTVNHSYLMRDPDLVKMYQSAGHPYQT